VLFLIRSFKFFAASINNSFVLSMLGSNYSIGGIITSVPCKSHAHVKLF